MMATRPREPYFHFDAWQCPVCGNVMTDTAYTTVSFDAPCVCRKTTLSQYRFVKAKASRLKVEQEKVKTT